jgi:Domain of unknown function (DUF5753)
MSKGVNGLRRQIELSFIEEMRRLHLQAGRPTLKEMEDISKQTGLRELPQSTTHDILTGKRLGIPALPLLISFVTVCRICAERTRARLDQLDTVEDWRERWYRASRASIDTAPWPVNAADIFGAEAIAPEDKSHSQARQLPRASSPDSGDTATVAPSGRHPHNESASRATVLALARYAHMMTWWHAYRDVVPDWFAIYLSLEPAARRIRAYETTHIPDLLQTEEYARVIIRLDHQEDSATEIDRRVELRMRRQQILHGSNATTLWVIIEEEAFRRPAIPAAVMRAQIEWLIQAGQQPNIALQVMTGGLGAPACHATAGGPITILRFPEPELPDVVYLQQRIRALYPDKNDIYHYTQVLDRLGIEAKYRAATMNVLNRLLADT